MITSSGDKKLANIEKRLVFFNKYGSHRDFEQKKVNKVIKSRQRTLEFVKKRAKEKLDLEPKRMFLNQFRKYVLVSEITEEMIEKETELGYAQ